MENDILHWPVGPADVQTPDYAATLAVTVKNRMTILKPAILTGDSTLNLTISPELPKGSILLLKVKATANADDMTLGTGIEGAVIVGVAGKNKTQAFVYDGTEFLPTGAAVQID